MEAEMNAIIESLCGPGGPGISGSLVDREASSPFLATNPSTAVLISFYSFGSIESLKYPIEKSLLWLSDIVNFFRGASGIPEVRY